MPKIIKMQKKGDNKFQRKNRESLMDLIADIDDPKIRKVLKAIIKAKT